MSTTLARFSRRAIVASLSVALLGAAVIVHGMAAPNEMLEFSHKGVNLIGVPPSAPAEYDVPVIGARHAVDKIRAALDLLLEKSPYGAAVLKSLKDKGRVVIAYVPGFPFKDASSSGARLAAFVPDLLSETPNPSGQKDFPVVIGRYIVKWKIEDLAVALAHELVGHGKQHLLGRLHSMSMLDSECEASLYEEMVRQHLGMDKHSEVAINFRQLLEWRWCVPFKEYMAKHARAKMALWNTMNPDVPRLHAIFEDYLRSIKER